MARLNPDRRLLVTTLNTALATAAVTATAVGWAAFGMSDTSAAANANAQPNQVAAQPFDQQQQQLGQQQQPFSFGRHRGHRDGFGFGAADPSGQGQSQPSFGFGAADPSGQGQSQPSFGGSSQPLQPLTSTRSSR
jgi:hypothetical protein